MDGQHVLLVSLDTRSRTQQCVVGPASFEECVRWRELLVKDAELAMEALIVRHEPSLVRFMTWAALSL